MKKMLLSLILVSSLLVGIKAQTGSIMGRVVDSVTNETIPGANVYVMIANKPFSTTTDINGNYHLKNLNPGTYTLHISFVGYNAQEIKNVPVNTNKITGMEKIALNSGVQMETVEITYIEKAIDIDPSEMKIRSTELIKLPQAKDINMIISMLTPSAYVSPNGKDVSFRGSRYGSVKYIVDGIKQLGGSASVPSVAIASMMVYMSGVPAKYGDFDGGVVVIETKSFFDNN